MKRLLLLLPFFFLSALADDSSAPVTAVDDGKTIVIDNGILSLTFSKQNAQVISIQRRDGDQIQELGSGRESFYWDSNSEPAEVPPGVNPPNKGYSRYDPLHSIEIARQTPDFVEIVAKGGPGRWLKFEVEPHWILFRGDSGFYSYLIVRHPENQPAATFWQTRFVSKFINDGTFTHQVIRDGVEQEIPTAAVQKELMDATYLLADGTVKTKYNNSVVWADVPVYGVAGKRFGLWSISASGEYYNGAPVKQGQTTHDNVLLRVLQSVHFGAAPVVVAEGEAWSKIYGPFLTYTNTGDSIRELWDDAVARQKSEAARWPYTWTDSPLYAVERGSVTGQWTLPAGETKQGALVVLAAPGGDWPLQGKGYQFFTRTGPDGRFTLPKVAPGRYTLYAIGADQPDQLVHDGVEVRARQETQLGALSWSGGTGGPTLWQLGIFDRNSAEFRGGDDARNFEMFRRYAETFPEDIDFVVGKSDPARDWNYAHWTWYSKTPEWKLRFQTEAPPASGDHSLVIGIASAQPLSGDATDVEVSLNGTSLGTIALGKTGTSGYRGGTADTKYNVVRLPVPSRLIEAGENTLILQHKDARPFREIEGQEVGFGVGHVMYDAIRLEAPRPD